jgi:hypothetical protein
MREQADALGHAGWTHAGRRARQYVSVKIIAVQSCRVPQHPYCMLQPTIRRTAAGQAGPGALIEARKVGECSPVVRKRCAIGRCRGRRATSLE